MFSEDQAREFREEGFVRIPRAVSKDTMDDMLERLWSLLESKGARQEDPSTWKPGHGVRLHAMRGGDPSPSEFPLLSEALDVVFGGADWFTKPNWGQTLVTFPTAGPWELPRSPWHLDHPFAQGRRISGLNMFLFVERVEASGGGTVVVRSSPQLIGRFVGSEGTAKLLAMKSAQIKRRFFGMHPYLLELTGKPLHPDRDDRLMGRDTEVDGIPMRVVELVGEPGDVVLCHPWLLHSIAPNTANRPRFMRASRVYRRDFYDKHMKGLPDDAAAA
jgi:hypothetical protein